MAGSGGEIPLESLANPYWILGLFNSYRQIVCDKAGVIREDADQLPSGRHTSEMGVRAA